MADQIIAMKELSDKLSEFSTKINAKIDKQISDNTEKEGKRTVTNLIEILKDKGK